MPPRLRQAVRLPGPPGGKGRHHTPMPRTRRLVTVRTLTPMDTGMPTIIMRATLMMRGFVIPMTTTMTPR